MAFWSAIPTFGGVLGAVILESQCWRLHRRVMFYTVRQTSGTCFHAQWTRNQKHHLGPSTIRRPNKEETEDQKRSASGKPSDQGEAVRLNTPLLVGELEIHVCPRWFGVMWKCLIKHGFGFPFAPNKTSPERVPSKNTSHPCGNLQSGGFPFGFPSKPPQLKQNPTINHRRRFHDLEQLVKGQAALERVAPRELVLEHEELRHDVLVGSFHLPEQDARVGHLQASVDQDFVVSLAQRRHPNAGPGQAFLPHAAEKLSQSLGKTSLWSANHDATFALRTCNCDFSNRSPTEANLAQVPVDSRHMLFLFLDRQRNVQA